MAIDYRCPSCGKLLRVDDTATGRQAQCPQCGNQSTVPAAAVSSPIAPPAPVPLMGGDGPNPFQSPTQSSGPVLMEPGAIDQYAAGRVAGPAIAMIVVGALEIVTYVGVIVVYSLVIALALGGAAQFQGDPHEIALGGVVMIAYGAMGLLMAVLVVVGAVKMKNLKGYGLAMASAIIAMLPCSPCCAIGLPFGIWALVVLNDENVQAAFYRPGPV
jgi:hypothetical protein